jgi:hypothetical protein
MDKQTMESQSQRSRGQTLAEFALTLPILLLLLFGIVEFGRLFQSWVTLQNAARTAVRFASTGQIHEDRYNYRIPTDDPDVFITFIDKLVVCETNVEGEKPVGELSSQSFERGRGLGPTDVQLYGKATQDGVADESLYATWYGLPEGCAPGPDTDQNRKDILRLPSIYEEARRGAAGILIENARVVPSLDSLEDFLFSQFQRPHPHVDNMDWFDVVICSSRKKLESNDNTDILDVYSGVALVDPDPAETERFALVLDNPEYAPAACVLRETAVDAQKDVIPQNGLVPWMDAGSGGDRVTVVITFNHRLITPIGLADFVKLQAQRSAINESFRVTNAERALGPSAGPPGGNIKSATPEPPEEPDTETPTATLSVTPTLTPTDLPTGTPEPFNCDNIDAFFRDVPFSGNRLFIEFANFNHEPAFLLESEIHWSNTPVATDYPNMSMAIMALDTEVYWFGDDDTSPTIAGDEGELKYDPTSRDHYIFLPPTGEKMDWQGQFVNGPANLFDYFTIYDFHGTTFVFDHPDSDDDCEIEVYLPPIPTATPIPEDYNSPTPTNTPDCAQLTLTIQFVGLEIAGDVTLRIINDNPLPAPFTGFNIVWPAMSGVGLDRVVFGGKNALDTPDVGGVGIVMWDSPSGGGDTSPGTNSEDEDTFLTTVTIPAYSNTLLHLDFVGVASQLPLNPSDLNGSTFEIFCAALATPFANGNGNGDGAIFIVDYNTPIPTLNPPATWTPLSETYTPTYTPSPAPPTNTKPPKNTKPPPDTPDPDAPTDEPEPTDVPPPPEPTATSFGGGFD